MLLLVFVAYLLFSRFNRMMYHLNLKPFLLCCCLFSYLYADHQKCPQVAAGEHNGLIDGILTLIRLNQEDERLKAISSHTKLTRMNQ